MTENIVEIPVPEVESILEDIKNFWDKRDVYKQNNMVYKRGVLLFGSAGTGKSYIIQRLIKHVIEEKDGIAISLASAQDIDYYVAFAPAVLRAIEVDRPVIIVLEEIDELLGSKAFYDTTSKLLSVLDGLKQLNGGTLYLATTNSIGKLNDAFKNRPGRFDLKRRISLPSDEVRLHFLKSKLSVEQQKNYNLQKWVDDSKNFSLAHLKELIVSVAIMNQDYEKTICSLKAMSEKDSLDDNYQIGKIGF